MHVLETKNVEVPVQFDVDTENMDSDLKFPIESVKDLETLENKLQDKNFQLQLVCRIVVRDGFPSYFIEQFVFMLLFQLSSFRTHRRYSRIFKRLNFYFDI